MGFFPIDLRGIIPNQVDRIAVSFSNFLIISSSCKSKGANGDNVRLLIALAAALSPHLLHIISFSLNTDEVPECWKNKRIVAI